MDKFEQEIEQLFKEIVKESKIDNFKPSVEVDSKKSEKKLKVTIDYPVLSDPTREKKRSSKLIFSYSDVFLDDHRDIKEIRRHTLNEKILKIINCLNLEDKKYDHKLNSQPKEYEYIIQTSGEIELKS